MKEKAETYKKPPLQQRLKNEKIQAEAYRKKRKEIQDLRKNEINTLDSSSKKRLHIALDCAFILACINVLVSVGTCLSSFFISGYYGEISLSTLIRIEGILAFVYFIILFLTNLKGFHWLYDNKSIAPFISLLAVLCFFSSIALITILILMKIVEPLSVINLVFCLITFIQTITILKE